MQKPMGSKGQWGLAVQALLVTACLQMATGVQAAEKISPTTTTRLPVSLNVDSSRADESPENLSRADLQRVFKARCPGRVERLLSRALPSERPQFKVVADICACAAASVDSVPDGTTADQFKIQAAQAALACSKDTVTSHNEKRTRKALGSYLLARGLDAQQVNTFSQCAATTHWKNTLDAAQDNPRTEGATWWSTCTEQVGHKGLPEPKD